MYTIKKEFPFEASHSLNGLEEGHKCGRDHGHSYVIIIELKSELLNKDGFVLDYGKLAPIKEWIDTCLDHRNLNDVFTCQTSAENIAREVFHKWMKEFPAISAVEVKETQKTLARYEW